MENFQSFPYLWIFYRVDGTLLSMHYAFCKSLRN